MFVHIFAFRWKPGASPQQQEQAATAIRALQHQVPGLLSTHVGTSISPRSQGYTLTGVMHFPDQAAYASYSDHPAHQALLTWLLPLIEPIEFDFTD
jgi:hypothetical protein